MYKKSDELRKFILLIYLRPFYQKTSLPLIYRTRFKNKNKINKLRLTPLNRGSRHVPCSMVLWLGVGGRKLNGEINRISLRTASILTTILLSCWSFVQQLQLFQRNNDSTIYLKPSQF